MKCPNCRLINPDTAERCDCGYSFAKARDFLMKTCPFCAEEIKSAAIVCKHCGRDQQGKAAHMNTLGWYLEPWKKYAVFDGRARRKEFWLFHLGNLIIALALGRSEGFFGIAAETDKSVLVGLFQLATLVPSLALGVRRMHDTDHPGWWVIAPIVNVVFSCRNGTRGENRFGANPKAAIP